MRGRKDSYGYRGKKCRIKIGLIPDVVPQRSLWVLGIVYTVQLVELVLSLLDPDLELDSARIHRPHRHRFGLHARDAPRVRRR